TEDDRVARVDAYLPTLEIRRLLAREGAHSTSVVGRAPGTILKLRLDLEEVLETPRHRRVQTLLGQRERFGRPIREHRCVLARFRGELRIRPNPRHQSNAQRLGRLD